MKYNNLLIIIIFLVCSCSKRNNDNGINLNDKGRLFISQIADSVSYIHLEMNEQCLLGDISYLLFQKNIYYVFDGQTNSIYLFDEKGFFVNKIFKQGRGPGEYVHPSSFFIDPEDNIHIIDLLLKKILVYDNKGDFLDEFWIEEYVRDFCVINDKYFFYMPDQNINSKQGLYLYDTKNKQYEEFIKIKGTSKSFMPWYITSLGGNDSYSVVDPVNNYVYYFNYTGVFETKKFIFFPLADDVKNEDMNAFSLVFEVPSFDTFLRILSLRDDRNSICAGEGSFNGRKYIKLIDPDMNIVIVIESEFDYATITDSEREYIKEKDKTSSINIFKEKK